MPLTRKIFLTGFMGSGKTHWGRIWAAKADLSFYDLDERIEQDFKMSITEIFDKKGEEQFREIESDYLRQFEHKKDYILACGGGTPCYFDNMQWMKQQGIVIYLKADPEKILQQLLHETKQRPVIKNIPPSELLSFIQKKIKEREPYYSQAVIIADVQNVTEDSILNFLDQAKTFTT